MALKVQRGGEHFESERSEHATAYSALRIAHSAFPNRFGRPSQPDHTLWGTFWLRLTAALG